MADCLETPVALFIYNRPETTAEVFAAIRRARPRQIAVIADGPLAIVADRERTAAARSITERIDWPCEILRDYSYAHLGLRRRFESGMDFLFDRFEATIVLEDDCVPHPTFFPFCETLLRRYRDEPRVFSVTGSRLTPVRTDAAHSYEFSRYSSSCGWGTWRRAWRLYDPEMSHWPELRRRGWLEAEFGGRSAAYWSHLFELNWSEPLHRNWDYAWTLSCWRNSGLSVVPCANLVTNIGFGAGATHTTDPRSVFAGRPAVEMAFPLRHPRSLERAVAEDTLAELHVFSGNLDRLFDRLRSRIRQSTLPEVPVSSDARAATR